jgi:hypothetical protein
VPVLIRSESEVCPNGTVRVCLRHASISPSPPLDRHRSLLHARHTSLSLTSVEDHGDSWIALEALVQLPAELRAIASDHYEPSTQPRDCGWTLMARSSAGRGPGGGTRLALVNPSSITFLAIVIVARWRRRYRFLLGRGFRETLPQHVPVPGEAAEPQTPESDRPATSEWVMHEDSPHPLLVYSGARSRPGATARAAADVRG